MASPEPNVDPLGDCDQMKIDSEIPANLSESDLNLIKKMQMMSALPGSQPKNTRVSITPKNVPEILCTCPQKCDEKIPLRVRKFMFKYYHAMSRDRPKQELLLLRFIEMKSLAQRLKDDNKRVQCRYKAPICMKAIDFVFEDESVVLSEDDESIENESKPKAKRAKLDKEEVQFDQMVTLRTDPSLRYKIDKYGYTEVCQKAFMNVFLVPEKRVRAVREKLVQGQRVLMEQEMVQKAMMSAELDTAVKIAQDLAAGCKPLLQMLQQNKKLAEEEDSADISSQLLDAIDSDIELVNNFFYNQLWKPEMFEEFDGKDFAKKPKKESAGETKTTDSGSKSMSSTLLDETFDSVINASASMAEDSTMDETGVSALDETPLETETPLESEAEDVEKEDPLADPLSNEPLNLNVASSSTSPGSLSPDSSVSGTSAAPLKDIESFTTAMDLSVSSPRRNGNNTVSSTSKPPSSSHSKPNGNILGARLNGVSKSKSHRNGQHRNGQQRSEPMRKSSIQNILNNQQLMQHSQLFSPHLLPNALFNPDLSKYLSGLESSVSITPKAGRRRNPDPRTAAALTAQLIQNALNQSSLSITSHATVNAASIGAKYNSPSQSSLNQILNIPDSVSITPTLVHNSK